MKGHDVGATVAFADYTRDVDALRKQLADAQATVEALQRERDELREATKVICGHCCEPMAIPSKAILQSQLSALQGLVRELETLRDERDRLREALRPFAERWEYFERTKHPSGGEWPKDLEYADDEPSTIYLGQLKAAKAALTPAGGGQE